jgi:glycosyltransferase involved in cell wall biosynthesis
MRSLVLLVPGSLESLTGGYTYDRRMVATLRSRGWSIAVRELDHSFPFPTPVAREHASSVLAGMADGTTMLVDGLALGALPGEIEREAARLRFVALVHHPLAAETGLDPVKAAALEAGERRALAAVRLVIVTSRATAGALATYGVERHRIIVVEPGTDPAPLARGSSAGAVNLLCVATLIPRKGHEILLRALAALPELDWRLTCIGSPHRDPATAERVRERLRTDGLGGRVRLAGEMDAAALADYYDRADVFVLPTLYEGYGMVVAEALARGLPVVATATGAIAELVGDEAGLLVPPGDVEALTAALAQVLADPRVRERIAQGARRVRGRLPTWEDASGQMERALSTADDVTSAAQSRSPMP